MNYREIWNKFLKENRFDGGALVPKGELNPNIWDGGQLNPEVARQLTELAYDIIEDREDLDKIVDIIITGSSASYNWHESSDIDLHFVFDFEEVDDNFSLVKKRFDLDRINWNKTHDIFIKGHEVEIYFQDIDEDHQSLGVYSLLRNEWTKKPTNQEVDIDLKSAEKKADTISADIDHALDLYDNKKYKDAYIYAIKIRRKIKKMRSAGLDRDGIYSAENLAFKMLRNSDYLQKLSNLKINSYDSMMTLRQDGEDDEMLMENWSNFVNSRD